MRLPLATSLQNRDTTATKDGRMTNCYAEGDSIIKRPGTTSYATYFGLGQGQYNWNDSLYSIFNDNLIKTGGSQYNLSVNYPGQQYQFAQTEGLYTTTPAAGVLWTKATTPGWAGRNSHTQLSFNSKVWVIAGYTTTAVRDVWSSTDAVTWTQATAAAAFTARANHASCVFQGKMWVMGGATTYPYTNCTHDVWYSTDGVTWTQATAAAGWAARSSFVAWSYNGKMYIGGGYDNSTSYNDVWSSSDGVTWTQETVAAAFAVRRGATGVVYNGKMWLYGGFGAAPYYNDVYYSTDGITWTQATAGAAWSARYNLVGVVYNNKMWMLGGDDTANKQDVYSSTDGITWTLVTATATWTARSFHGAGVFLNKIRVTGGNSASTGNTEVWSSDLGSSTATGQTPYLFIKNANEGFYVTGATPVITQIMDADYPAITVPGVACVDGTFYVMDQAAQIFGSDLETPVTWTALNYISSEVEPGLGVVIAKQLNYVMAMKTYSIEFFADAANATGSPLARIDSAYLSIGCASAGSLARMDGTLIFMAQSKLRGRHIAQLIGLTPHVISTPYVERILNADSLSTVYAWCVKANGHAFYILTLTNSALTLVYDFISKQWGTATSNTLQTAQAISAGNLTSASGTASVTLTAHGFADGDPITHAGATQGAYNVTANITKVDANTYTYPISGTPASPATGSPTAQGNTESYFAYLNPVIYGNLDLVQHETDGKIYQIDVSLLSDNSVYINTKARLNNFDGKDNKRKFCTHAQLIADTVTANAFLRYSDNDYSTFSDYQKLDLSLDRKELRRLKDFRRRAFEVRHTDNTAFRAQALEIEVNEGAT